MISDINFIAGMASGITQTIIGHPFDTIKVRLQNKKPINYSNKLKLFDGIIPVLFTNSFINGVQFYSYKEYSPLVVGLISSILITPVEYYKTQKQTFGVYPKKLPRGFGITFVRETIAVNTYFKTYEYLEEPLGVFISGGLAGSNSWLLTYQIDTIKSRMQANDTFIEAIKKRNFNNGLIFCLVRSFLVNGLGFMTVSLIR